ncbi:amidohydrolase family protein [Ekhidna sp. To15]|uniref:amidohydrolase family protein n=1 Tax=Ekhidna sp. To15 TaxID=3395267 RepID=UPI003F51FC02
MKRIVPLFMILLLLSCGVSEKPSFDLIITNVNLIDGTGTPIQQGVNVYVKDRLIVKIESGALEGEGGVVDGTSKFLIPGLFDCHVHPGDFSEEFPVLMHYGITSIFIPGGSSCNDEVFAQMRAIGSQDSIPSPRVFHSSHHFTMEGRHPVKTYASSKWVEGETVFYLRDTAQISRLVGQVSKQPILGIKLTIEDGPAPPFVERIPQEFIVKTVDEASKYGLEVFAHVSDNEELRMAIDGGAQNLVHYTGVNINPEDTAHLALIQRAKELNVSWVTTLMIDKSFLYPRNLEWFDEESMIAMYKEVKGEITEELREQSEFYSKLLQREYGIEKDGLEDFIIPQVKDIQFLMDEGLNMVLGTDAGNDFNFYGYSLHEEMQLMEMGGIQPIDIIKMGTLNAAIMMHAEDSLGSIEVGKLADMILLDANPLEDITSARAINSVYKGGRIQKRIE